MDYQIAPINTWQWLFLDKPFRIVTGPTKLASLDKLYAEIGWKKTFRQTRYNIV